MWFMCSSMYMDAPMYDESFDTVYEEQAYEMEVSDGVTVSAWTDEDKADALPEDVCLQGFSENQQQKLQTMIDSLREEQDMMRQNASPDTNAFANVEIMSATDELLSQLQATMYCRWYDEFASFDEVLEATRDYYALIKTIKKDTTMPEAMYPEAQAALLSLQQQLVRDGITNIDLFKDIVRYLSTQNIAINVMPQQDMQDIPTINFAMQYDMDATVDVAQQQWTVWAVMKGSFSMEQQQAWEPMFLKADADAAFQVTYKDKMLYVSVPRLDVQVDGNVTDDIETNRVQQTIQEFKNTLGQKSIAIALEDEQNQMISSMLSMQWQGIVAQLKMFNMLQTTPMLTFVHNEWTKYYAIPSIEMCEVVRTIDPYSYTDCVRSIMTMRQQTDKKWFIVLDMQDATNAISLSDMYIQDELTEDDMWMFNTPVITRTTNAIQKIHIPMWPQSDNWFLFENNAFSLNYQEEWSSDMVTIQWTIQDKDIQAQGTILVDDVQVDLTAFFDMKDMQDASVKMDMSVMMEGEQLATATYTSDTNVTIGQSSMIQVPNDTISFVDFDALMQKRMQIVFPEDAMHNEDYMIMSDMYTIDAAIMSFYADNGYYPQTSSNEFVSIQELAPYLQEYIVPEILQNISQRIMYKTVQKWSQLKWSYVLVADTFLEWNIMTDWEFSWLWDYTYHNFNEWTKAVTNDYYSQTALPDSKNIFYAMIR